MNSSPQAELARPSAVPTRVARWLLVLAAVGIPVSLLWDFSWESTVGIDRVWAPPHVANYAAVALAAGAALGMMRQTTQADGPGVRLGKWHAPLGAWLALWGGLAFLTAFIFDRWWQAGYGLAAGIWHPPQLLKAAAFFAVTLGAWLACAGSRIAGGAVLALIFTVTLAVNFANRQHGAAFYLISCGSYPLVLAAIATAGRSRFPATSAALAGTLLVGALVWLLPLLSGSPQVAPIYHPRDHLLPPPFPPLLFLPALALDALLRVFPSRQSSPSGWGQAVEAGLVFFAVFLAVQWPFSRFLLSPGADHWFFAGGGRHWPFFLRIDPSAETAFWKMQGDELTLQSTFIAAGLAILATRCGLWIGAWMQRGRQ